jgi:peptide-methionine (S)-S-oxide reductase
LPGVWRTRVGYAGGTLKSPTYHKLGDHTESFQVDFDPAVLPYDTLLELFWKSHNPCASAWSRQYMSAIFYHGDAQKKAAEAARDRVAEKRGAVKTPILPIGTFTPAEDYHQKYELRGADVLGKEFASMFATDAEFVASTAVARANAAVAGVLPRERLLREIDRYGLSPAGRERLLAYAR